MVQKVYGSALKTGWRLFFLGLIGTVAGVMLGGNTGNTGFFALAALGVLLVIAGLVTVGVYAAMERALAGALNDTAPLLRFTISAADYAEYAVAEGQEIQDANKLSLIIALVFCGLVAIVGPFIVEEGAIVVVVGVGLAIFLWLAATLITKYRIHKLRSADREVVLTMGNAYVGGQFHFWNIPTNFLGEVSYFDAGAYENSSKPVIRITYSAVTRTVLTPYTFIIPIPAGLEEKAMEAAQALRSGIKPQGTPIH